MTRRFQPRPQIAKVLRRLMLRNASDLSTHDQPALDSMAAQRQDIPRETPGWCSPRPQRCLLTTRLK
jgi:hypothetical protein